MKKRYLIMALFALLVFSVNIYAQGAGDKASDFTRTSVKGEDITLSEVLKEKSAVLVFWTTWCPSCRAEIPYVEEFYKGNSDKVAVIGINTGENIAKVQRFLEKNAVSYPIVLDEDMQLARAYRVFGIPAVIAVNKEGVITYSGHSIEEMEKTVK